MGKINIIQWPYEEKLPDCNEGILKVMAYDLFHVVYYKS